MWTAMSVALKVESSLEKENSWEATSITCQPSKIQKVPIANNTIAGGVYIDTNGEYFTMSPWLAFGEGQHGDEELFVYKSDGKWET